MVLTGVLAGWLLTRVVERPVHRWLMRWWDRVPARYGRVAVEATVPVAASERSQPTRS
jgi:peptidoglycan/LPS O-acetylase OafA/YrhL